MSKNPFDYLVDDDNAAFFQKVACSSAEAAYGIEPPRPQPRLEKRATPVPETPFEKIAARLPGDIEMLKYAGDCGLNLGMNKRADAYIERLMADTDLSPEQFGEVFDKVAAAAIETDMDMAYLELCSGVDEEFHPWIEQELSKVAYGMAQDATMEKEAIVGLLRAGAAGLKAMGARGAAKAVHKGMGKGFTAVGKGISGNVAKAGKGIASKGRQFRVGQAGRKLKNIEKGLGSRFAKGQGPGAKAWRRSLQKRRLAIQKNLATPKMQAAAAKRSAAGKSVPRAGGPADTVGSANQYRGGKGGGAAPSGITVHPSKSAPTTAPQTSSPGAKTVQMSPAQQSELKAVQTQQETAAAQAAAAKAAKNPGPPPAQPAPGANRTPDTPDATPTRTPDATPDTPKKPKSLTEHWGELTPGQKAGLGVGAYMVHDTLKN